MSKKFTFHSQARALIRRAVPPEPGHPAAPAPRPTPQKAVRSSLVSPRRLVYTRLWRRPSSSTRLPGASPRIFWPGSPRRCRGDSPSARTAGSPPASDHRCPGPAGSCGTPVPCTECPSAAGGSPPPRFPVHLSGVDRDHQPAAHPAPVVEGADLPLYGQLLSLRQRAAPAGRPRPPH